MSLALAQPQVSVERVPTAQGAPVDVMGGGSQFSAHVDLGDPRMSSAVVSRPDGDWLVVDLSVQLGPDTQTRRLPERVEVRGRTQWRIRAPGDVLYALTVELPPGADAEVRVGPVGMSVDGLVPVSAVGTRIDVPVRPGARLDHRVALRLARWRRGGWIDVPLTYRLEEVDSETVPLEVTGLEGRLSGRQLGPAGRVPRVGRRLSPRSQRFPQRERR